MTSHTSFLLIGTLAMQANTTKDTIRHYDEMGLLRSRKRQAGSRLYTEFHPECIERVEIIKSAQTNGFTLNEVKSYLNDCFDGSFDVDKQINIISEKLKQVTYQQINLTNAIKQLSARHAVLEQMKLNNMGILSKDEWERKLADQMANGDKPETKNWRR
ncbi:MerR family transcriptional regulator [Psychrobacter sp. CAL346-MNA-CIBAN-0220]|uniref:MerR family transcriptional regulator n=1 Tax=Psychrobacter sp. CAL346-MNA-CIBAN-0220 TaxID=3140457 RepID=UPI0033314680